MKESKAIARRLVALSIKPLLDEVDAQCKREGSPEDHAMLAEVHALMDQLLGETAADGVNKPRTAVKGDAGSRRKRR